MHERERGEQRFGAAAQAAEWDARYGERDRAMWSGRPNGRLAAEVADLTPGRALDVGCGEGADAIWLARRGWTVTAIDISDVAVGRAREASELALYGGRYWFRTSDLCRVKGVRDDRVISANAR